MFPSYAYFRPKINSEIILDISYKLRGEHIQED
jgi:hypothetical protein